MILIDSCVLLDIFTCDPVWYQWSSSVIASAANRSKLGINQIIFAEVSVRFSSIIDMENTFPTSRFERVHLPFDAAFLAGKAFHKYKKQGGTKASPLPDFFIGAHAAVSGYKLLTRDTRRFRRYFPSVELIAP